MYEYYEFLVHKELEFHMSVKDAFFWNDKNGHTFNKKCKG